MKPAIEAGKEDLAAAPRMQPATLADKREGCGKMTQTCQCRAKPRRPATQASKRECKLTLLEETERCHKPRAKPTNKAGMSTHNSRLLMETELCHVKPRRA